MIYKIYCGKYSAVVNSVGAELISFSDGEKEFIWPGDSAYWSGHNTNLFPVIGRMKGGKIAFEGREFVMSNHGFTRRNNFDLVELSSDCIVLSLSQNEDTLSCYPFDFKLTITHKVFEGGFTSEYKVTNTGDRPLLYNLGGHPGINLPAIGTNTVEGCKLIFDTEETATVWYGDESIFVRDDYVRTDVLQGTDTILCTDELFDNDALMIGNMNSHSVKLVSPCGKGVEMDYTGFPVLGVWTAPKKHAPFLCLEPWHGLPSKTFESGEFCDKPYVITLAPAEENTLAYSIRIL